MGLWLRPTKKGVATTVASLEALEMVALKPARARMNKMEGYAPGDSGKTLALSLDCPKCHGITWTDDGIPIVSKEVQEILDKYNAIVLPLPHNTSTSLSPLDVAYLGTLKSFIKKVFSNLPRCWSKATDYLNPYTLDVDVVEIGLAEQAAGIKAKSPTERCLGMNAKVDMHTVLWTFAILHSNVIGSLEAAAKKGFRDTGVFPLNQRQMVCRGQVLRAEQEERGLRLHKRRECYERRSNADQLYSKFKRIIEVADASSHDKLGPIQKFALALKSFTTATDHLRQGYTVEVEADPEYTKRKLAGNNKLSPVDGYTTLQSIHEHASRVQQRAEGKATVPIKRRNGGGSNITENETSVADVSTDTQTNSAGKRRKVERWCDCGANVQHRRPTHKECLKGRPTSASVCDHQPAAADRDAAGPATPPIVNSPAVAAGLSPELLASIVRAVRSELQMEMANLDEDDDDEDYED